MCFHIETTEKWWSVPWISADCANKRQVFSYWASLVTQWLKKKKKNPPANTGGIRVQSLDQEGGHAARSSILAWRIPWPEGPAGLQSMGSQRIRDD